LSVQAGLLSAASAPQAQWSDPLLHLALTRPLAQPELLLSLLLSLWQLLLLLLPLPLLLLKVGVVVPGVRLAVLAGTET
jgi:hypothetical protein